MYLKFIRIRKTLMVFVMVKADTRLFLKKLARRYSGSTGMWRVSMLLEVTENCGRKIIIFPHTKIRKEFIRKI